MRRINDFSVAMTEVGMWAKVAIEKDGEHIEGIIGRCSASKFCFACNSFTFNGSYEFKCHRSDWDFVINEYSCGWVIMSHDCGDYSIPRIISQRGFNAEIDELRSIKNNGKEDILHPDFIDNIYVSDQKDEMELLK